MKMATESGASVNGNGEDEQTPKRTRREVCIKLPPPTSAYMTRFRDLQKCASKQEEDDNGGNSTTLLTLNDPSLLDCVFCRQPLRSPVFQCVCESGSLSCYSCCKNQKSCPSCSSPSGFIRSSPVEKIVESLKASCVNVQYGCMMKMSYHKKLNHETTCEYAPVTCPGPWVDEPYDKIGCKYVGDTKSLYKHGADEHRESYDAISFNSVNHVYMYHFSKHVILQEMKEGVLFAVRRIFKPYGSFIDVICIAQPVSGMKFSCDLTVRAGKNSINLKRSMELTPKWFADPPKEKCLLITKDFCPDNEFNLEVIIQEVF